MLQPVGLSEVTAEVGTIQQEVGSIQQMVDGGFASVLAAMSSAGPPAVQAPSVPGPAGDAFGVPTALALSGGANQDGTLSNFGPATDNFGPATTLFGSRLEPVGTTALAAPGPNNADNGPAVQAAGGGSAGEGGNLGAEAAALAEGFVGVPYLWGGESPEGFDCSGLVQYVYRELRVDLPRTSQEQAMVGTPVANLAGAQPGDLVFFAGADGSAQHPGHVGIYIGNGEMVDAPYSGSVVQVQPVGQPTEIRRVLPAPSAASPDAWPSSGLLGGAVPAGRQVGLSSPQAAAYGGLFARATAHYALPAGLLEAMAQAESAMDPEAVSSAGAEGLMQLMPDVAANLGVDPFEPSQAVPAAAELMSSYLQRFGSLPLALAAYNAGPAAVSAYGGVPPYPATEAYVAKVLGLMGVQG